MRFLDYARNDSILKAKHGFREASKTRSASIYDGERTQKYVTPRKAERDTVLRSLYEAVRINI